MRARRGHRPASQASLFDVSDPAHPVRLDREPFGRARAREVEFDHHAFSWFADSDLAMLPVDSYAGGREHHLAVGLRVSAGSVDPLGRVAKLAAVAPTGRRSGGRSSSADRVYTLAANGIDAYDAATLTPIASLRYYGAVAGDRRRDLVLGVVGGVDRDLVIEDREGDRVAAGVAVARERRDPVEGAGLGRAVAARRACRPCGRRPCPRARRSAASGGTPGR